MSVRREPKMVEMCPTGDERRFMCLMEIGGEIYGGGFALLPREEDDPLIWASKLEMAWRQARERVEQNAPLPEASSWEEFAGWLLSKEGDSQ